MVHTILARLGTLRLKFAGQTVDTPLKVSPIRDAHCVMRINFLLLSSLLFLVSGLALDAGMMQLRKVPLPHAAAAAALGAVYEKARANDDWASAGMADAALNGFTNGVNGVTIRFASPPTSGRYAGNSDAIQATVSQSYPAAFMGLVSGSSYVNPRTSAVAAGSINPDCVYLMGLGSSNYTVVVANYTGFYSSCNKYLNSVSRSLSNQSGSTLIVSGSSSIKIQGTSTTSNLFGYTSPSPAFGSASEEDPLGYEVPPAFSSCTYTNTSLTSTTTLNPGTYCGGIAITGASVSFNPGLYIVTGDMTWQSGSTITGTGRTFYLTTGGVSSYGSLNILSSNVSLSAPTSTGSGGITGSGFFIDRNWSNQGNQGIQVKSSYVATNGIWNALNTGLNNYISTITGSTCLGLAVDNITTWSSTFTIPSPNDSSLTGGSPFASSTVGGIVE